MGQQQQLSSLKEPLPNVPLNEEKVFPGVSSDRHGNFFFRVDAIVLVRRPTGRPGLTYPTGPRLQMIDDVRRRRHKSVPNDRQSFDYTTEVGRLPYWGLFLSGPWSIL